MVSRWIPKSRNYDKERIEYILNKETVNNHPLIPQTLTSNQSQKTHSGENKIVDPLSANIKIKEVVLDPLSVLSNISPTNLSVSNLKEVNESKEDELTKQWMSKKQQILKRFEYTGEITVSSSTINEFDGSGVEDGSSTRYLDKYTQRLATLEKRAVTEDKVKLSQIEYENHIKRLASDLQSAWSKDERVLSLKIAIQLAKLLADTTIPKFYPSMFVMITNELDKFGVMVFQRLKTRAEEALNEVLPVYRKETFHFTDDFKSVDVPSIAKETCRNWFYKIACVRELVPRVYIEMALLRCYRFLTDTDFPQILSRLASIIRGIGDPLVSTYARLYLNVIGNNIKFFLSKRGSTESLQYNLSLVQDMIFQFKVLREPSFMNDLQNKSKLSKKEYHKLLSPAIDWLIQSVFLTASKQTLQTLLSLYRDQCLDQVVLKYIIDYANLDHYATALLPMIALIKTSESSCYNDTDVFTSLGKQLLVNFPVTERPQKLMILNEVWKAVSKCEEINAYIRCAVVWIEIIQKYYTSRELLVILSNLGLKLDKHMALNNNEVSDYIQKNVEAMLVTLLNDKDSSAGNVLLSSEHILKILDIFSTSKKTKICKEILVAFKNYQVTTDAVLINTMFSICRILHDSIDSLSSESERNHISSLLSVFINKIDFGRDLEQQLNTYTECRALFCNLDNIKEELVMNVCTLGLKVIRITKGKHTKKTSAFAKSCLAYCYITIPSIKDIFKKLDLLLFSAQVALINQCLPQTDSFIKAAISLLPDVPSFLDLTDTNQQKRLHTEERVSIYLANLLSFLVITPGHPDNGAFYLIRGLVNALSKYSWQNTTHYQLKVNLDLLTVLTTLYQMKLPYHIQYVESNDELYGSNAEYRAELDGLIENCINDILSMLAVMGEKTEIAIKVTQAKVCLDFVNRIAVCMESTSQEIAQFLIKLLKLSCKLKSSFNRQELRYYESTLQFVKNQFTDSPYVSPDLADIISNTISQMW